MPVKDNVVTHQKEYHLIATISHTGNLNKGHYTSFIKMLNLKSWFNYNHAAVLRADENKVNNTLSYTVNPKINAQGVYLIFGIFRGACIRGRRGRRLFKSLKK